MPSRFAACPPWAARLLLALALLLIGYGVAASVQPAPAAGHSVVDLTDTDLALYEAIAGRVGGGESYYDAAVAEQRARDYPLRPVVTVRLPTLAWIVGALGPSGAALLLKSLMAAALIALALRLKSLAATPLVWGAAGILAAAGLTLLTVPAMTYWHESWAALLIVLSLSCRTQKQWVPSLAFALAAVLIRELALPYLVVMSVLAWRDGRRIEALGWAVAMLIFAAAMALHASTLAAFVTSADAASPGWSGGGGWLFVLDMMQRCSLLLFLPLPLIALLVPLALLGWASLSGPLGERIALLQVGYAAAFTLLGRPDNFYWGILIAPLLPIGLAFAPRALADLIRTSQNLNFGRHKIAG